MRNLDRLGKKTRMLVWMLINLGCRGGVCRKVPTRRTSNLHELLTLRLLQPLDVAHTQVGIQHQPFCPHNSPPKKIAHATEAGGG